MDEVWEKLVDTELGQGSFKIVSRSGYGTPYRDTFHIIGNPGNPGFPMSDDQPSEGDSLAAVVLPYDQCDNIFEFSPSCEYLATFNRVVKAVHRGSYSFTQFTRTGPSGQPERVNLNFAPVLVTSLKPLNSSDFSRGTEDSRDPVFTVSFGQTERGVMETFNSIADALEDTLRKGMAYLVAAVVVAFLVVLVVSWVMAESVAIPVAQLCTFVTSINR